MSHLRCELVLPDIHVPYEDRRALRAIHHYIEWKNNPSNGQIPITGLTQVGDLVDFEAVSRHNMGKRGLQEGLRISDELKAGESLLRSWRKMLGATARITLIEGNHEFRIKAYLEQFPELEGILDVPSGLGLEELGVKWVPYWTDHSKTHQVGKLSIGHGYKTSKYHSGTHVDEYGCNFMYGHTHAIQSFSRAIVGKGKIIAADSIGCLVDLGRPWTHGRPDKWEHAFVVLYVQPSGHFQKFIVRIHNGRFTSPEGYRFSHRGMEK